tara:strand:- start:611 stop:874 length:264 start_codon:yes stop_codon:yes gene_type:complete
MADNNNTTQRRRENEKQQTSNTGADRDRGPMDRGNRIPNLYGDPGEMPGGSARGSDRGATARTITGCPIIRTLDGKPTTTTQRRRRS